MKTIKSTPLLKQGTITLAVVALFSLLTACATTASPNAATQTASTSPVVTRDNARDMGVPDYLGASHGSGMMGR